MHDIIWAINPEHDNWEHFLARFRRFASELFESLEIEYSYDLDVSSATRELSMEQRHNLWLLLKEIVTNAAKHANCQHVAISIKGEGRVVKISIQDNGVGFDASSLERRSGLKNIEERVKMLGGEVQLETSPGMGVHWELRFTP